MRQLEQRLTTVVAHALRRHLESGLSVRIDPEMARSWLPVGDAERRIGFYVALPTLTATAVTDDSTVTSTTMRGSDGLGDGPLHVPADAGEFAAGLAEILRRIPAGAARFLGVARRERECGACHTRVELLGAHRRRLAELPSGAAA